MDCLAASDLDALLSPLLGDHYVDATTLYDVRTGRRAAAAATEKLVRHAQRTTWLLAPLHVRYHWTTAIITLDSAERLRMTVLDSAPSPVTRTDIADLARRLHATVRVVSPFIQPPRSNECGLHVVLYGALCATGSALTLAALLDRTKGRAVDLQTWRQALAGKLRYGLRPEDAHRLLDGVPAIPRAWRLNAAAAPFTPQPVLTPAPVVTPAPPVATPVPPKVAAPVVTIRQHDPYAANVIGDRLPPPPYTAPHVFTAPAPPPTRDVSGGNSLRGPARFVPCPLPNEPGENVCFANALAQALGQPELASRAVKLCRKAGMNYRADPEGSRRHEDPSEVFARFARRLGVAAPIQQSVKCDYPCGCTRTVFLPADYVQDAPAVSDRATVDGRCERCKKRCRIVKTTTIVKCGNRVVFAVGRGLLFAEVSRKPFECPQRLVIAGKEMRLVGVVLWFGSDAESGHYYAYRRDLAADTWYCLNDMAVSIAAPPVDDVRRHGVMAVYESATPTVPRAAPATTPAARPAATTPARAPVPSVRSAARPAASAAPAPTHTLASVATVVQRPAPRPATATPAAPTVADPVRLSVAQLSHAAIRKTTATLRHGDVVEVHWAYAAEAGRWSGTVDRSVARGSATFVEYSRAKCDSCGEWHELDTPATLELPYPNATYFVVERRDRLPEATPHCDPDRDELDVSADEHVLQPQADASTTEHREAIRVGDEERACVDSPATSSTTLNGNCGREWTILPGRPPHVHVLTWRQLAASTRSAHAVWLWRIHGMPADLSRVPLGAAIVELTLRYARDRNWAWSTIASNLSCAASALRSLPLYTNATKAIDLRDDVAFSAATRRAQHLARVSTGHERLSAPIALEQFADLAGTISVPSTWLLAQMCWFFAARVGDMRQVRAEDVTLTPTESRDDVRATVTFRFGKGAAFWGPYTIHAVVPRSVAQALASTTHQARPGSALFSAADQDRLSKAVREVPNCSLRSLRRGALVHLASRGVSDEDLQLLSGHKRRDTLLRYLGWGTLSSTARSAAEARAAAAVDPVGGSDGDLDEDFDDYVAPPGRDPGAAAPIPARMLPAKMGLRSGYVGHQGRRVKPPPKLFPLAAPSAADLGIPRPHVDDSASWPLHVKRVGLIDWDNVEALASHTPLQEHAKLARKWVESDADYGIDWAPLAAAQVPLSRYTPDQVDILLDFGKLVPHTGAIRSFAKGWPQPQAAKRRLRPIFEPFVNGTLVSDRMPQLRYPSRLERRAQAVGAAFQCEFDFSAYYDQIELAACVRDAFVIRTKGRDGRDALFRLTRLPMGVCFAVGVAQVVTWTITLPIASFASTCIDNVRIVADNATDFLFAVRTFLERCDAVNVTINDRETWALDDAGILQRGHNDRVGPFLFLGEEYNGETIRNSEKNVTNLTQALALFQEPSTVITRRRFAAIVGLIVYMSHTVNIGLWRFFSLLRAYSRLASPSSVEHGDVLWDAPIELYPTVLADLTQAVGLIAPNAPVALRPLLPPGRSNDDYDTIVLVDASAAGWAAFVRLRTGTFELRCGWHEEMLHSAHSEPYAARDALQWARTQQPLGHAAVVTDHQALATGQRRWHSAYAGFSSAFHLNDFFAELYGADDLGSTRRDVFFVDGVRNVADGPSRSVGVRESLSVRPANIVFPDVSSFVHPFASREVREVWQV